MNAYLRVLATAVMICAPVLVEAAAPISRRDGFLLIWNSIRRPVITSPEKPFADVARGSTGEAEITYAKYRGLIDDVEEEFRPNDPLTAADALLWIFRTRSMDPPGEDVLYEEDGFTEVAGLAESIGLGRYVSGLENEEKSVKDVPMTEEDLLAAMRFTDAYLRDEEHEVSLYSEKFHGKGTAFGESFDMHAMTAAHRTFPHNTLVEVTNLENGKSIIVRINDRGPYVDGRDMDLSLGSFTMIAPRSKGKIQARFRRLGDANLVGHCEGSPYALRLGRTVRLNPGFPYALPLGQTFSIGANDAFVVRSIRYPDGFIASVQDWVLKDERYKMTPSVTGEYVFRVSTKDGVNREFTTHVVNCAQ